MTTEQTRLEDVIGESVSRETFEHLATYRENLLKWNKTINLVAQSQIDDIWGRHFVDSAQMSVFLPPSPVSVFDLGSGGGFPGLVLALIRPDCSFSFVESDQRKCFFLKNVSRETSVDVSVYNRRIEEAVPALPPPDIVTARALASLDVLFSYVMPWVVARSDITLLFMKGRGAQEEIKQARANYDFDVVFFGCFHHFPCFIAYV